jgi:hypothetical protein
MSQGDPTSDSTSMLQSSHIHHHPGHHGSFSSPSKSTVVIQLKLPSPIKVTLTPPTQSEASKAYGALMTYAFPGKDGLGYLFCFEGKKYLPSPSLSGSSGLSGKGYDVKEEFKRMGCFDIRQHPIKGGGVKAIPSPYRTTDVNGDYQVSRSYPRESVVPRIIKDKDITGMGRFRSGSSMTGVSWL